MGLIDFGDMSWTWAVSEVAITIAYMMLAAVERFQMQDGHEQQHQVQQQQQSALLRGEERGQLADVVFSAAQRVLVSGVWGCVCQARVGCLLAAAMLCDFWQLASIDLFYVIYVNSYQAPLAQW